ncbi:MAG: signal peptide peptidase SppA [Flavobacteriales bacterium]
MRSFFKIMLATMVGFLVINIFLLLIFIGIAGSLGKEKEVELKPNSVLHLKLDQPINDRSSDNPFENFSFSGLSGERPVGLHDILNNLEKAAKDDNIQGIFLDISSIPTGLASIEEIRNALRKFKDSGKYIYAYSETYSQPAVYVMSVADQVYMHPMGYLELKGLRAELMFFKGVLEKIGVEPMVFKHGKFKSAVEPFISDKMSDANREQIKVYMGSLWNHMTAGIAAGRKIDQTLVLEYANTLRIQNAEDAKEVNMIDAIKYRDEVLEIFKEKTGAEKLDKINFVSLSKYNKVKDKKERGKGDKIAVIFAEGEIVDGEGETSNVGSERFTKAIRKARLDEKVKAVVLRVNSPGGSALASESIWREIEETKKVKPVVTSMGDVAASGGYYIACNSNKIFANPTTITGSIGVFGLLFNAKKMLNEKLGVTIDTVKTSQYADFMSQSRPVTSAEAIIIQNRIEEIYDNFITRVAEGRGMNKADVDSIGQGRVWSGIDAKRIGLIDEFGGLEKAIEAAAELAEIKEYRVTALPERKDFMSELLKSLSGDSEASILEKLFGENYKQIIMMKDAQRLGNYQMRMPFYIEVK